MSKHHNPQRNSMMPAPTRIEERDPNPYAQSLPNPGPLRTAYVVDRIGNGWRLRVCELPESVVTEHVRQEHEPDVYAITSAKMGGHLDKRAMAGEQ